MTTAADVVAALVVSGRSVAVAESLTGGLVVAELVSVPGASAVVRGGIVAYATELKHELLGVDAGLLAERGAVDGEVARQMAVGIRDRLGSDIGIALTGVAGPDPHDGHAPGEVWIGVADPTGSRVRRIALTGDRERIRRASVAVALDELRVLATSAPPE